MSRREPRATVVLLRAGVELASWPLMCVAPPDLGVVDELARLALAARRAGCTIWLRAACPHLLHLLELAGLAGVVRGPGSETGGEAEDGEQVGVEEVVVADDPVA